MNESDLAAKRDAVTDRYWAANVRIMTILLVIWAVVGLGCGILFADALNAIQIGGFPLGFWFAQQGSIAVFVVLILIYALTMNRLDRIHHEEWAALDDEAAQAAEANQTNQTKTDSAPADAAAASASVAPDAESTSEASEGDATDPDTDTKRDEA